MARKKPIPRNQRLTFNRGEQISRTTPAAKDDVKNISVGMMDMDSAIMYYFNEVIQPTVNDNKEVIKVPCLYASPERWVSIQKRGFMRDKKQQLVCPVIVFRRTSMSKDDTMPQTDLDGNLRYTFKPNQIISNFYYRLGK